MGKKQKYNLSKEEIKELATKMLTLVKKNMQKSNYQDIITAERDFIVRNASKLQYLMEEYGFGLKENNVKSLDLGGLKIEQDKPTKVIENLSNIFGSQPFFDLNTKQEIFKTSIEKIIFEIEEFINEISKDNDNSDKLNTDIPASLKELEHVLLNAIFDQYAKNPTLYYSKSNISDARKKAIKERDNFQCQFCQEIFLSEELEVDHIFPRSLGGSNDPINLMSLCREHNRQKLDSLGYFNGLEGKNKIFENIRVFVKELHLIGDFGGWLKKMGDSRIRNKWKEDLKHNDKKN